MAAFPGEDRVAELRAAWPRGTRVELVSMDDPQAPPRGARGTVTGVDDAGLVHVSWDTGSTLALVPGEDGFRALR